MVFFDASPFGQDGFAATKIDVGWGQVADAFDAHAKNYSLMLAGPVTLAPLYDVSTVLPWDHVNQYHAQKLAGRKRKPGDLGRSGWNQIALDAGLSPRGIRLRVQKLVDAMVGARVQADQQVAGQPGAVPGMVDHVADLIERNALRIAARPAEQGE